MTMISSAARQVREPSLLAAVAFVALLGACAHAGVTAKEQEGAEVHNDLGVTAFQNGHYQEAMQEFMAALAANPDFPLAHEGMGVIYMYYWTGARMADAKKEFRKAVALDPHYADAWNNLGTIYAAEGDLKNAQEAFEKALGEPFYKTPWVAQTNLGWVVHLEGDTEHGKMLLRQALVTNQYYCMAHKLLARVFGDEGKTDAADGEWELFAQNCPKDPEAAFHKASILMKHGDSAHAGRWFRTCAAATGDQTPMANDCRTALLSLPPEAVAPEISPLRASQDMEAGSNAKTPQAPPAPRADANASSTEAPR